MDRGPLTKHQGTLNVQGLNRKSQVPNLADEQNHLGNCKNAYLLGECDYITYILAYSMARNPLVEEEDYHREDNWLGKRKRMVVFQISREGFQEERDQTGPGLSLAMGIQMVFDSLKVGNWCLNSINIY